MRRETSAFAVTYPALMGAVSLILLYIASISPTGSVGLVALAGIPCAGVVVAGGARAGLLCWAVVSVLGFFLVPDQFCVLLYAAILGLYPVVKSWIEGLRRRVLEVVCKLAFFNLSGTVVIWVTKTVALQGLPLERLPLYVMYLLGNVVFVLYDFGFSKLIASYVTIIGRGQQRRKG